jgi:hypothetical protein
MLFGQTLRHNLVMTHAIIFARVGSQCSIPMAPIFVANFLNMLR